MNKCSKLEKYLCNVLLRASNTGAGKPYKLSGKKIKHVWLAKNVKSHIILMYGENITISYSLAFYVRGNFVISI